MTRPRFRICLTFDLDGQSHLAQELRTEEMEEAFRRLVPAIGAHRRAVWFVRLDRRTGEDFGKPDHHLERYRGEWESLRGSGHELGWHPHCYRRNGGEWVQDTEESTILEDLQACAPIADAWRFRSFRMGWGFMTNGILSFLENRGFRVDSSAIPRPVYAWERSPKDWSTTPLDPYHPSRGDFRVPGVPCRSILEVPISVAEFRAPYDQGSVQRYFNPAYRTSAFREPLRSWTAGHDHVVMVCHPYEILETGKDHPLLSFSLDAFRSNLDLLEETIRESGSEPEYVVLDDFLKPEGDGA